MKKYFNYILFFAFTFFIFISNTYAREIKVYFFHGDGCPHCAEEEKVLSKIENKYSNLSIVRYEVWNNKDNAILMGKVGDAMDVDGSGVPLTVIGSSAFSGYSDSTYGTVLRAINYYQDDSHSYTDFVSKIKNGTYKEKIVDEFSREDAKTDSSSTIKLPLFGKVNMKNVSLPTAAFIIGFIDGFNPCAMWVLLFLISMLLGMKNRKRMWILGISFLLVSAIFYMSIMLSWFNLVYSALLSVWFRRVIALVALIGAFINIKNFVKSSDSGCHVVDSKKRKKIFQRIKKFTSEKSFILALVGVMALAISVNVVELACSAGFPLIFTQLLALNQVSSIEAFYYTLIYIFFFLIDDIVVFVIAMATTKVVTASTKYNKYSHLVSGILMFIIGILLILKPEWLMFNFS
ncbi:MAG: hypothetical protein MR458_04080 [Erysipelotrichaceae bacterium]|nr:hypothetical protein [Erysipelotrichaceae bacterium]